MDPERAISRLLAAYNERGMPDAVTAAFAPTAHIARYGVYTTPRELKETISGNAQIAAWLQKTPDGVVFSCPSEPSRLEDGTWVVRYRYCVAQIGFKNGGEWHFTLDASERIASLVHIPDPLKANTED